MIFTWSSRDRLKRLDKYITRNQTVFCPFFILRSSRRLKLTVSRSFVLKRTLESVLFNYITFKGWKQPSPADIADLLYHTLSVLTVYSPKISLFQLLVLFLFFFLALKTSILVWFEQITFWEEFCRSFSSNAGHIHRCPINRSLFQIIIKRIILFLNMHGSL